MEKDQIYILYENTPETLRAPTFSSDNEELYSIAFEPNDDPDPHTAILPLGAIIHLSDSNNKAVVDDYMAKITELNMKLGMVRLCLVDPREEYQRQGKAFNGWGPSETIGKSYAHQEAMKRYQKNSRNCGYKANFRNPGGNAQVTLSKARIRYTSAKLTLGPFKYEKKAVVSAAK